MFAWKQFPCPRSAAENCLLRVHTCGVCGTDLKKIATGSHSAPRIFGHETSGVVAAVGAGVSKFEPGDRVVVFHHIPCRECYYCRHKTFAQCADLQKSRMHCRFRAFGRRFRGIRPRDGLDRRAGNREDSRRRFVRAGLLCGARKYLHERDRSPAPRAAARRFWSSGRAPSASY